MQDLKNFIGLVIGLEHKGRPCKMCDSVRQKLAHTKVHIKYGAVPKSRDWQVHKGQLISKGLFGILNSLKKRTKKFNLIL